jgi:formiminotetrahydrofolate cyclodeaminase
MIRLELDDGEVSELRSALAVHLHELRAELTAADAREYRAELREQLERLERIAARLEQPLAAEPIAPV